MRRISQREFVFKAYLTFILKQVLFVLRLLGEINLLFMQIISALYFSSRCFFGGRMLDFFFFFFFNGACFITTLLHPD